MSCLSYKGVIYKKHLIGGLKKGALTEAQVEQKFNKWVADKDSKVNSKKDRLATEGKKKASDKLNAETARKEAIAAKNAAKAVATPEADNAAETPAAEEQA
ncbi:MAG: hypothetical protein ACK5ZT_15570 [Sphingobacteriaceae bacterium]